MKYLHEILKIEMKDKDLNYNESYINLKKESFLKILIETKKDNIWEVYNFFIILTALFENFNWDPINNIEAELLKGCSENKIKWYKIKRFQLLIENLINEMIKKDIDIQTNETPWVSINLDSLYKIDLTLDQYEKYEKMLPRTKDINLKKIIINDNLVIASLDSFDKIVFYNKILYKKSKKNELIFPDIIEKINFTKGYVILLDPITVNTLKNLIYRRKLVTFNKTIIKDYNVKNVANSLNNNYYSKPIWMKNLNITKVDQIFKENLEKNILYDEINTDLLLQPLNYLNSFELKPDLKTFNYIYNMGDSKKLLENLIITKNVLKNSIYGIGSEERYDVEVNNDSFDNVIENEYTIIQSAAFLELVKIQYYRFESFFFQHRYDSRTRIYNYNYPLNYQLSHLIRLTIKFINDECLEENIENALSLINNIPILKQNHIDILKLKIFHYQKIKDIDFIVEELILIGFKIKYNKFACNYKEITKNMKLESILMIFEKMAPKKIIGLDQKILYVLRQINNFIKTNLEDKNELDVYLKYFNFKKKKIIYLIQYQIMLNNIIKDDYSNLIWIDASSNGLQLITLRIGDLNETLLQITNIIDNKTSYNDIYSYITEKINKHDHCIFLKDKISNKITSTELISLQNESDNKDRIMPASYGKGKITSRNDINSKYINCYNVDIWKKLNKKEQDAVSDYFWDLNMLFLKEIGFNLDGYKKLCKNLDQKNNKIFCWYSDSKLPIAPINTKKTKRHYFLKKIEILKLKKKETINKDDLTKIEEKIKILKEKLYTDEKIYYKRTTVLTKRVCAKIRIPFSKITINKRETTQALIPNTIHSYDASNMIETLKLMEKCKIKGLTIFDSIGSDTINTPIIKILFKIANIKNIEGHVWDPKFPFKDRTINIKVDKRINLYSKILESTFLIK